MRARSPQHLAQEPEQHAPEQCQEDERAGRDLAVEPALVGDDQETEARRLHGRDSGDG